MNIINQKKERKNRKNKMRKAKATLLLFFFLASVLIPQVWGQNSSILSEKQFLELVSQFHPMAKQANLLSEKAKQNLMKARGNFDPYVDLYYQEKQFNGKRYYEYSQNAIKIPTWVGVDVETGWDFADKNGKHFNEEKFTYSTGTGYVGVSVPLAQGLLIDKRRAEVKKARIYEQASEAEKIAMLNDLLFDAVQTYWDWAGAYHNLKIVDSSLSTSKRRLIAIKNSFLGGDKAGIDTVEAFLQVQSMTYFFNEATVEFQNKAWLVSNFLWNDNQEPIEISTDIRPEEFLYQKNIEELNQIRASVDTLASKHPQVQLYQLKRNSLEVDRKFKADKLKPKLKFKYQQLTPGYLGYEGGYSARDNYKVGLSLEVPLFLREARGNLALTKLKIQEVNFKLQAKNRELITKLKTTTNKLENINRQIDLYESAVQNYETLLKAEDTKVFYGESSLFKVNAREQKLLNARQKLIQLKIKHFQTKSKLAWISGQLGLTANNALNSQPIK